MGRYLFILMAFLFFFVNPLYGDDIDLFTARVKPNVLILVDNSLSMNAPIFHPDYDPSITYSGGYDSGNLNALMLYSNSYQATAYPRNGRIALLYSGPGDDNRGVRYPGNYLNWIFWYATEAERNSLPQMTRIQAARQVLTQLVDNTSGVNFGLMKMNNDNGGNLVAACGSTADTVKGAIADTLALTYTPVSESMVEAWLYFKGDTSYYNSGNYESPIDYTCQKNFIILITDGAPTLDYTFPSWVLPAISGHYDPTPMSGNSNYPYYLDGVAWYLKNNDAAPKLDGTQNILTYTIGFTIKNDLLQRTAANGGGQYFTADNANQLLGALQTALSNILDRSASFTSPSVLAVRTIGDDNVAYLTSFQPSSVSSIWKGDMAAYYLKSDGTLAVDANMNPDITYLRWHASDQLRAMPSNSRKIYTVISGAGKEEFKTSNSNLTTNVLNLGASNAATEAERIKLIDHIRGKDTYDMDPTDGNYTSERLWKLGDIFHSNPVIVGSPNPNFHDDAFQDAYKAFYLKKKDRTKAVIAGANDGMLHAFNAATGKEEWAFIPNSLLKNLISMKTSHTYYVDSSPRVADVWFYGSDTDTTKSDDEWRTVLVCGLRKGGKTYFALDITDTLNPIYLWEFPNSTDTETLAEVGQSWSEPAIGRVKIEVGGELYERWVAFIGGGFDDINPKTNTNARAFFVIDIKTGAIIKEFYGNTDKHASPPPSTENKVYVAGMDHAMPAPPAAVDTNADGYIDKVYIGDLGGQMWVFDVSFDASTNKSNSQWTGGRLFAAPKGSGEKHQIYFSPAVALDLAGIPWVFFGTGNKEDVKESSNPQEGFYAVKDDGDGNYPRQESDLSNVTASSKNTFTASLTKGWYLKLLKSGNTLEKLLAKPTVFQRLVYFTTYLNPDTTDPCVSGGSGNLYAVEYLSGGGAFGVTELSQLSGTGGTRYKTVGSELPSAPVISINTEGRASVVVGTTLGKYFSQEILSPPSLKNILYWREVIP